MIRNEAEISYIFLFAESIVQITVTNTCVRFDCTDASGTKEHFHDIHIWLAIFISLQTSPESSYQFQVDIFLLEVFRKVNWNILVTF